MLKKLKYENQKFILMLEIVNGSIFINGVETNDAELIGYALLDFAVTQEHDNIKIILKDDDVFVEPLN